MIASHLDKLNALISWHERYLPNTGRRIKIILTPTAVGKLLGKLPCASVSNEFTFRDRTIIATKPDGTAARFLGGI